VRIAARSLHSVPPAVLMRGIRGLGQSVTAQVQNLSNPAISPNMNVGDKFLVTVTGAPNSPVVLQGSFNGTFFTNTPEGTTDANGNFTLPGTAAASDAGAWYEVWIVANIAASPISFNVGAVSQSSSPTEGITVPVTAQISNTALQIGDSWTVTVKGAPNSPVSVTAQQSGQAASTSQVGTTDANGNFSLSGTAATGQIGTWAETWTVAGQSATITFSVSAGPSAPATSSNTSSTSSGQTPSGSTLQNATTCFSLFSGEPCIGPIGAYTLAAGVVAMILIASLMGGRR
jgi:hypothetical protein